MFGKDKKRLYLALYPSGVANNEGRKYHLAFLIGPKIEGSAEVPGTRYHVRNTALEGWKYEEKKVTDARTTIQLLARVVIAKVEDEKRLVEIMRNQAVIQNDPNWWCGTWCDDVLKSVAKDGKAVGTTAAGLDWTAIVARGRQYVQEKQASGRYQTAEQLSQPKPTFDMIDGVETVP